MKGLMGEAPLTVGTIFERLRTVHADAQVVDALPEGTQRITYGELADRVLRWVTVLRDLGVRPGDRVGTFAHNTSRHLELYYAVPLLGAVLHMVNIRLHDDQLAFVVADADDTVLVADVDLADRVAALAPQLPSVRRFLAMGTHRVAGTPLPQGFLDADELVAAASPATELPELAEDDACGMCHTSGTTGLPKAVVYSHRGTFLHALACLATDSLALGESDTVLPVVPLFHACGWGLPYSAPLTGADLVLVGRDTSPATLARVVRDHGVTWAAGVPTIWTGLLGVATREDLASLRTVGVGGSATPPALLQAYDELGVTILQIWGMTETGPVACVSRPRRGDRGLDAAGLQAARLRTGTILPGLEARVCDPETGEVLPWDGTSVGELECRGPWVASDYHRTAPDRFHDGWLRTGDMAVLQPDGVFRVVDRSKDLVKSGGEWISSVELEGACLAHPVVREAAVVGVRSERWDERPAVVAALHDGASLSLAELRDFLAGRVARWWLPDELVVVDEVAKTSVGKYDKKALRQQLAHVSLP